MPVNPVSILLTYSYHLGYDIERLPKRQLYRPLVTLNAATALQSADICVAVFDPTFANRVPDSLNELEQHQPSIAVSYREDFSFVTKMCLSDSTNPPAIYIDNGGSYPPLADVVIEEGRA
jgi:anaerobic magnesium-protoporphyrin IX monomethyl ester cyclase